MKRILASLALPALALSLLLSLPGDSYGWGYRYGGWGHHYGGWGHYYGGWGHHYGGWGHYYGGWWPRYYAGWGYPRYSWGGYYAPSYYSAWPYYSAGPYYYSYSAPLYTDYYAAWPNAVVPSTGIPASTGMERAYVHVRVPADAQVFFDNTPMTEKGVDRRFVTPPLDTSRNYSYQIKAKWTENGNPVEDTRTVQLIPGRSVDVDFTSSTSNVLQTNPIR
jgi:uncharacterized protein (TIGR03000 family)